MCGRKVRVVAMVFVETLLAVASLPAAQRGAAATSDYLAVVRAYADAMLEHGRDVYGDEHSPLFAEELDRRSMRMLEGDRLKAAADIPFAEWGIRPHDRMLGGANPQHCQNLYQILYGLTAVSGAKRYAEEADRSLKFFFEHCQSPATGLFWWGEHAGWDLRAEAPLKKPSGNTHEFYRPWVLWDRSWQLSPERCRRFALGLWEHQIGDQAAGDYSRHAAIDAPRPGKDAPYARHGGFYIETWAAAYKRTQEPVFLAAIRAVVDGLERARLNEGGMLISNNKRTGARVRYDVSLAVSLEEAAANVPADLAAKLRAVARSNDEAFAEAHRDSSSRAGGDAAQWSNAYGSGGPAAKAAVWAIRFRQVHLAAYRKSVLDTADRYGNAEISLDKPVWPGTVGCVVFLMLDAYELTGDARYLAAADRLARKGMELFLGDGCPLPKASHRHDHYEAVTNGDTLILGLFRLWLVQNGQPSKVRLVYTDR